MTELFLAAGEDHYVLLRPLGRGGTAGTWLARREGGLFPDEVCIKRPVRHLSASELRSAARCSRKHGSWLAMRHANVVQLPGTLEHEADEVFWCSSCARRRSAHPDADPRSARPSTQTGSRGGPAVAGFTDEQRAIDELRQNVADACTKGVIEVPGGSGRSCCGLARDPRFLRART